MKVHKKDRVHRGVLFPAKCSNSLDWKTLKWSSAWQWKNVTCKRCLAKRPKPKAGRKGGR